MRLDLGSPVRCDDGDFGVLADVVLEPASKRVTHLVVCPHGRSDHARLVPIDLLRRDEPGQGVQLDCAVAEVEALEAVRESAYLRVGEEPGPDDGRWEMGIEQVGPLPFPAGDLGMGALGPLEADPHVIVSYDRVPKGEVEIRSKSTVISADGHGVGHVDGLVIEDAGGQLTHVVLEHGHLWGKREVTIPIADVEGVRTDEIVLGLTKDQVGALEHVKAHPPAS
jgi:sporulation protein YlmC with PRC-barrel domain